MMFSRENVGLMNNIWITWFTHFFVEPLSVEAIQSFSENPHQAFNYWQFIPSNWLRILLSFIQVKHYWLTSFARNKWVVLWLRLPLWLSIVHILVSKPIIQHWRVGSAKNMLIQLTFNSRSEQYSAGSPTQNCLRLFSRCWLVFHCTLSRFLFSHRFSPSFVSEIVRHSTKHICHLM